MVWYTSFYLPSSLSLLDSILIPFIQPYPICHRIQMQIHKQCQPFPTLHIYRSLSQGIIKIEKITNFFFKKKNTISTMQVLLSKQSWFIRIHKSIIKITSSLYKLGPIIFKSTNKSNFKRMIIKIYYSCSFQSQIPITHKIHKSL